MENSRELGDELTSNVAVQTGGITLLASAASSAGVSSSCIAGVGALTTGKAALMLTGLGPVGLFIGATLFVGGCVKVLKDRYEERNKK